MCGDAEHDYNVQIASACKIVPDLSAHLYPNPTFQTESRSNQKEFANFYSQFAPDLLTYKMTSWFCNGAKSCYTGRYDTFKFYPEIGVLTSLNISRIDELLLDDVLGVTHYADQLILTMLATIDLFFMLYFCGFDFEMAAHKKLHKFQLLN